MLDAHFFTAHIVTPERTMYSGAIISASVPTESGVIAIRSHHQPLFGVMRAGELIIKDIDGNTHQFAVDNGVVHHDANNVLTILADRSEEVQAIDIDRAEAAYARARQLKTDAHNEEEVDYARFQALIDKELNRIKIGRKYQ